MEETPPISRGLKWFKFVAWTSASLLCVGVLSTFIVIPFTRSWSAIQELKALHATVIPFGNEPDWVVDTALGPCGVSFYTEKVHDCLLYTSDAADDLTRVDLGGRRIIK